MTGLVDATDFPVLNAFQNTFGGGGGDAFLFKLAPDVAPPSPFSPIPGTAQFTFVVGGSVPAGQTIKHVHLSEDWIKAGDPQAK